MGATSEAHKYNFAERADWFVAELTNPDFSKEIIAIWNDTWSHKTPLRQGRSQLYLNG